jgi:hypothetical protein
LRIREVGRCNKFENIVAFPPVREPLKRGASKHACNSRRTSVYSSLLSNARNSRKSSHASPSSLVATQHRSKNISEAVSRHVTIAATFSVRLALTNSTRCCVLRVSDSSVYRRDRRQCRSSRSRSMTSMSMTSG